MKIVSLFIPLALCLVQCATQSHSPRVGSAEWYQQVRSKQKAEHEQRLAEIQKEIDTSRAAGKPLIINRRNCITDSAGGNKVSINFTNSSGKPIKYIDFEVSFLNPVGDRATCSITGKSMANLKVIGPFEDGKSEQAYWEPSIYYNAWCYIEIRSIKIDYMDGTSKILQKSEVDRLGGLTGIGENTDWNSFSGAKHERENEQKAFESRYGSF
jgi:hypothetical protein